MRDFYVYGFMSREDFKQKKSLRSYDNEKRRIESYLSDYMSFRVDEKGKAVFLSVDSSDISENPLYRAFKAKTFTKNDITLNFILLDILQEHSMLSATEIADLITVEYLSWFASPVILDLSTIRNKLTEYVTNGIFSTQKQGKKLLYYRNNMEINLDNFSDALMFFSEVSPLGVVGSYLLDKCIYDGKLISYKHHYILHALESEIVYELLKAIHSRRKVEIMNHSIRSEVPIVLEIVPLRFMISVQGGRRYLAAFSVRSKAILSFRLDYIKSVRLLEVCDEYHLHENMLHEILPNTWGASFGKGENPEKISMLLDIPRCERHMIHRILREGRSGTLSKVDESTYRYEITVYDTTEMLPWLRTFIGRIISLECSNKAVERTFYHDLEELYSLYGGGLNTI
jgi:Predicted transcriptional regulator